jgi:carboxylesterase type B
VRLADAHAASARAATYMYEFAWPSPQAGGRLGAAHGVEIPFVFDTLGLGTEPMLGREPPQSLADEMHRAWVSFAKRGDCGWRRYDPVQRPTKRFAAASSVVDDPLGPKRVLWEGASPTLPIDAERDVQRDAHGPSRPRLEQHRGGDL